MINAHRLQIQTLLGFQYVLTVFELISLSEDQFVSL